MGLEVEVVGENNKFDVVVIGGGIAGMIASSTVTQRGLKSCFLEKEVPGGKLTQLDEIHNFPPQPGIKGTDLALGIFNQVTQDVKTSYVFGNVQAIRPKNDLFYLFTEDGQTWEAKAIIICVGTVNKKLNVKGEDKYFNKGVTYCVMCDAALAKNKKVVLVGNTTHLDYLKSQTNDVTILKSSDVEEILGDENKVTGVLTKQHNEIKCDFVFVEDGYVSATSFLPSDIKLNENKEIVVDPMQQTSFAGAYAAGDCTNSKIKMILPAMQQATNAAINAVNYIQSRKW